MELVKTSSLGLSREYRFTEGEERKSILMMAEYLGFKTMLKLVHAISSGQLNNRMSVYFVASLAGVEGYPVDCFISWIENFYGVALREEED